MVMVAGECFFLLLLLFLHIITMHGNAVVGTAVVVKEKICALDRNGEVEDKMTYSYN